MDAFGPSLVVPSVNRFFHRVAEKKIRESSQSTVLSTLTTAYDVSKKGLRDRPTSLPVVLRLTSYLSDTNSILSQSSRPRPLSASCLRPSALRSVIDPPSKASLQRIEGSPTPDLHATRKQPEREHMDPECEGEQGSCVSRSLGTTEASACISPSEGFWDVVHKPAHGSSLDNDFISSSDFWHSPSAYAELSSEQIGYSPETSLEAHTSHEPLESTPRKRWLARPCPEPEESLILSFTDGHFLTAARSKLSQSVDTSIPITVSIRSFSHVSPSPTGWSVANITPSNTDTWNWSMYSPLLPQSRSIAVSVSLSSLGTIIRRSTSKLVLYSGSKFQSQEAQSLLISSPFDPCDEGPISVSSTPEPDSISIPRLTKTVRNEHDERINAQINNTTPNGEGCTDRNYEYQGSSPIVSSKSKGNFSGKSRRVLERVAMFSGSTFVRKFNLPEFPGIVSHDARTQRDIEGLREKGAVTHGSQAIVKAIRDKRE